MSLLRIRFILGGCDSSEVFKSMSLWDTSSGSGLTDISYPRIPYGHFETTELPSQALRCQHLEKLCWTLLDYSSFLCLSSGPWIVASVLQCCRLETQLPENWGVLWEIILFFKVLYRKSNQAAIPGWWTSYLNWESYRYIKYWGGGLGPIINRGNFNFETLPTQGREFWWRGPFFCRYFATTSPLPRSTHRLRGGLRADHQG